MPASRAHPTLCTIGYATLTPDTLVAALRARAIEVVADVREAARSRRPGFSKSALAATLQAASIEYRQFRDLGVPKPGRDAYHHTGDFTAFAAAYEARLDANSEGVQALADLVRERRTCLLCLEADPARCHRSLLAARLAAHRGFRVVHLDGN